MLGGEPISSTRFLGLRSLAPLSAQLIAGLFGCGLAFFASSAPVSAHPLGNFTINHLTVLRVQDTRLFVRYVLDEAEIPSFSSLRALSADGSPSLDVLGRFSAEEAQNVLPLLHLQVDGRPLQIKLDDAKAVARPGAGGLSTLYWVANVHADGVARGSTVAYDDTSFPDRIGWKDVVVKPGLEPTDELRHYPSALIGSPRDTTSSTFTVGSAVAPDTKAPVANVGPSAARSNQLSDLLARGTGDWRIVLTTFLVAVFLGGLHALEPGHGKTLLAVSLVGARATKKQALILATSLTFAHTIAVVLLGVVLLLGSRYIVPEMVYPWITLVSGIVIAVLGARAISRYVNRRRHQDDHHGHAHGSAADHDHDGIDDEEHARLHAKAFDGAVSFRGAVFAAMSGGIAPCPAALVVLLTAVSLHQVAYGLAVIIAFSVGLAGVLTGLGISVVRGASWLSQRPDFDRFVKYGPLVSAVVIALIGSVMVGQGFAQNGIGMPEIAVIGLTIIATMSYGFWGHVHAAPALEPAQRSPHI